MKDNATQQSYAELDRHSDDLAQWLVTQVSAPGSIVGVFAARSCETIVAFLGILKAGLAYMPLDVNNPVDRIKTILLSVPGRKVVLVGFNIDTPSLHLEDVEFISIAVALHVARYASPRQTIECCLPSATSLAYVMFTSGSTGRPKGVMIEHRGVVRLVKQTSVISEATAAGAIAHNSRESYRGCTGKQRGRIAG